MQDFIAILLALAAAGYLLARGWRNVVKRRSGQCGGCSSCSAATDVDQSRQVVSVDELLSGSRTASSSAPHRSGSRI